MSQNLSSAAVVIGVLRVNRKSCLKLQEEMNLQYINYLLSCIFLRSKSGENLIDKTHVKYNKGSAWNGYVELIRYISSILFQNLFWS